MVKMWKHEYLEGDDKVPFIRLLDGYPGLCFTLGRVSFGGTDEEPVLQFEYNIIEGSVSDVKKFEEEAAYFLLGLIEKRLKAGELLYSGGEDAKEVDS